jgi:NAD(P)-dependent dehydrogenase (short-subunit alcohol dehydrogenase family)
MSAATGTAGTSPPTGSNAPSPSNHLALFLLTDLLLDRLRDSAPARVVTVSSSARTGSAPPAHADGAAAPPVPCTPRFTRRKAAVRAARKGLGA